MLGTGHRKVLLPLPPGSSLRKQVQPTWPATTGHSLQGSQVVKNWSPQLVCQGPEGELAPTAMCGDSVCRSGLRDMSLSVGRGGPCRVLSCIPGLYPLHVVNALSPNRHACSRNTSSEGSRDCSRRPVLAVSCPRHLATRHPGAQQSTGPLHPTLPCHGCQVTFQPWETRMGTWWLWSYQPGTHSDRGSEELSRERTELRPGDCGQLL